MNVPAEDTDYSLAHIMVVADAVRELGDLDSAILQLLDLPAIDE